MRKLRVAIMADEFDRRPEHTLFFRRMIEALYTAPNVELTLVHSVSMPDEPMYQKAREVLLPQFKLPFASRFASYIYYCLTTKDEYDVVHSFKVRLYPLFWLFPAKKRIIMAHGGGERLAPGKWTLLRYFFVWNVIIFQRYIDAFIAVSDYGNREIIYAFHVPPEKVFTIYPHLDETYHELPSRDHMRSVLMKKYGLEEGSYFTYIGRFRIHKNVDRIVEAYLRHRENNPTATERLALGGGTKEEYERVFGKIRNSPYAADITFHGHIPGEHMPILFMGARALLFTTLNEGFGVPIIEGFACGTPVITSSVTAMPEVAGNAGLVVDPYDPSAIAAAMTKVANNKQLRTELITRGLARCKLFTWDKVIEKTFALYEHLTGINPGKRE